MTVYSATKSYVSAFSYGITEELRAKGIRATAVCPGPMDTEFIYLGAIKGNSKTFDRLPYCNPEKVAKGALKAARRGRMNYTPHPFYKLYKILGREAFAADGIGVSYRADSFENLILIIRELSADCVLQSLATHLKCGSDKVAEELFVLRCVFRLAVEVDANNRAIYLRRGYEAPCTYLDARQAGGAAVCAGTPGQAGQGRPCAGWLCQDPAAAAR